MKVRYKNQEPEIVLQPNVYAMFDYIANNVKTNLVWVCLVRKLGNKYIVEDLYFPPQNVNEWVMCNFSEEYMSRITYSTFSYDYRVCRFNMVGRFTIGKSTEIDNSSFKDFEKVMHPLLDECLMMQLNNKMEMNFAVNRKATFLSELSYTIDMGNIIDKGAFQALLDSKVGKYSAIAEAEEKGKVLRMERKAAGATEEAKPAPKSAILAEKISWKAII